MSNTNGKKNNQETPNLPLNKKKRWGVIKNDLSDALSTWDSLEKNQAKIGKTLKVIIDKKEAGRYIGRTEFDSVEVDNEVIIQSKNKLTIGDFVNVKINAAFDYDIEGQVV